MWRSLFNEGSGPQELGQFLISHCPPSERAVIERAAVAAYYKELTSLNPLAAGSVSTIAEAEAVAEASVAADTTSQQQLDSSWTLEQCWAEYVSGGLGRWLFFLPYDGWGAHHSVSQYFCDQVLAFIRDHGITPDSVPMPRL